MVIMTDSVFLFYLLGILCFDAIFVICFRGKMTVPLALVRVCTTMAMFITGYITASIDQMAVYGLSTLIFLYNSWFVFSTDDDLAESGPVGRWLVNTSLEKMKALEKADR